VISQKALTKDIHQALRSWHKVDYPSGSLLQNLLIVQGEGGKMLPEGGLDSIHLSVNRVLLDGLEELGKQDRQYETILRKRFLDQETSREVGYQLNFSEDSIYRRQAQAIAQLAEIIWLREKEAREAYVYDLEGRLQPQSYSLLFGVEQVIQELKAQLLSDGDPWLILLTGIGGIGKTAVADQVARRIIGHHHFQQIAFVRAQPFSMSGRSVSPERTFEQVTLAMSDALDISEPGPDRGSLIRRYLKTQPHLVIVDNIEEAEDAAYLITYLANWARPSKFLITSRARPISTQSTKVIQLGELPPAEALALVRYEAKARNIDDIIVATDQQLAPLTGTLGGNPLALKLAVALLEIMPMPAILADLRHGRTSTTKEMYKHIYWQAWRSLSRDAQALLEAMPLVSETGGTQEQLQVITALADGQFWQAVQELTARSLLEMRGTIWDRRYGIHRLTETFLNTEITGWDNQSGNLEQDN
jgi:hypothetical protein